MKNKLARLLVTGCLCAFGISCMLLMPGRGSLIFAPDSLPAAQVGVPYEAKITISNNATPAGEFSISEGALPGGLTLETLKGENSARIFGTPTEAGTFKFKVFVWCYGTNISGQTGEKDYSLAVQ